MLLFESFLLVSSIILISFIGWYAFKTKETRGAHAVGWLMIAGLIWSFGTLLQRAAQSFEWMLFWRNFQQIGVFGVPALSLYFAVTYTDLTKLKPLLRAVAIISTLTVVLIFTNELHGLMRSGYEILESPLFGHVLVVTLTPFGNIMIAYNFLLPILAVGILIAFYIQVDKAYKKSVGWLIIGMVLTIVGILLQESLFRNIGFHISIATFYSPTALIFFFVLYRKKFFALSPIARDKVFQVIQQGIFVLDMDGFLIDINQHAHHLFNKILGKTLNIGENITDQFKDDLAFLEFLNNPNETNYEKVIDSSNAFMYLNIDRFWLLNDQSKSMGQVLLMSEVTEKRKQELELQNLAQMDSLTSFYNRRTFQEFAEQAIQHLSSEPQPIAFLVIDIDHFKIINDQYGHPVGDEVLRQFSICLKDHLRSNEVIGRLGGEEFGVVLPGAFEDEAYAVAERIRLAVQDLVFLANDTPIQFTVSIGLTVMDSQKATYEQLFKESDQALYEAKARSRNCTVAYSSK